jgi:hypothetical protein
MPVAPGDPLFSRGGNLLQVPGVSIPYGDGADDKLLAAAKWVDHQLKPGDIKDLAENA